MQTHEILAWLSDGRDALDDDQFAQFTAAPPPVTVKVPPLATGLLNSVNLSPMARAAPRLVTVTVPVPPLAKAPLTDTMSLAKPLRFTRKNPLPFSVRSPLTVSVPMAAAEPPPMDAPD